MYVKEKIVLAQEAISKSFACKKIKNGDVILIYSWWVYFYLLGLAAMTDISGSCVKGIQEYLQSKINFTEPGWNHE